MIERKRRKFGALGKLIAVREVTERVIGIDFARVTELGICEEAISSVSLGREGRRVKNRSHSKFYMSHLSSKTLFLLLRYERDKNFHVSQFQQELFALCNVC